MNAQTLIKEIWAGVTKKEIAGWLFFTGGVSLLVMTQTILWEVTSDQQEIGFLVYRIIMSIFFMCLAGMGMYLGYKAVGIGWHLATEDEFWRAFSGGLLFSVLHITTLLIEMLIPALRSMQWLEYLQGIFYVGIGTGFGMVWYLYLVGYVRKKNRIEEEEEEESA